MYVCMYILNISYKHIIDVFRYIYRYKTSI